MASLTMSRPFVTSPLADPVQHKRAATKPPMPRRSSSFALSQAPRPFASISAALRPTSQASNKKPTKIIEPPVNQRGVFVLNLTQAEFSRQD